MAELAIDPQAAPAEKARKSGFKKLLIVLGLIVLVGGVGGAGAFYMRGSTNAQNEGAPPPRKAPVFMPLESFTVNLADKELERYAQIGITLELSDPKFTQQIKEYMPVVRDGILKVLAHKSSDDLLDLQGKERLAGDIMQAVLAAINADGPAAAPGAGKDAAASPPAVRQVLFTNIIVQ